MEPNHKKLVTSHRQQSFYIPGVIVRKISQQVYAFQLGNNKIPDQDHEQIRPRAPDHSGPAISFEFMAGHPDSDNDGE